jgi:hypothetical protein
MGRIILQVKDIFERMKHKGPIRYKFRVILVWCIFLVVSVYFINDLFKPQFQTGPFGIGLPAPFEWFSSDVLGLAIKHPQSWVATVMLEGNRGNRENVLTIGVPGRSWPRLNLFVHAIDSEQPNQTLQWVLDMVSRDGTLPYQISDFETERYVGSIITYSYPSESWLFGKKIIECDEYVFAKGGNGYRLSFCWEQRNNDLEIKKVEKIMIDSFEVR